MILYFSPVVLKDYGMVPYIKIFLDDECYRSATLSILEQLSVINYEEYMSIVIGALCSSTQGELNLKLDLLKVINMDSKLVVVFLETAWLVANCSRSFPSTVFFQEGKYWRGRNYGPVFDSGRSSALTFSGGHLCGQHLPLVPDWNTMNLNSNTWQRNGGGKY